MLPSSLVPAAETRFRAYGLAFCAGITATAVAAGVAAGSPGSGGTDLRQKQAGLSAHAHQALLGLYALDSQLDAARARLTSLQAQLARLERRRADTRTALVAARRTLTVSQAQLGTRLRAIYEEGTTDPIAVLLGSKSLDEAVTGLDTVDRTARLDKLVIRQTSKAKSSLTRLSQSLAAREGTLRSLTSSATAAAAGLARARAARAGYLARLNAQERLTSLEIASLDAQAHAAEAKGQALTVQQGATGLSTFSPPLQGPSGAAIAPGAHTLTVVATAYSLPGSTATGIPTGYGVVAVDPAVIPLGTRLTIPGYGDAVAADTGVHGLAIDVWVPTLAAAYAWGRRVVTIVIH
jgi:cystine transport system substrate-binding protein